MPISNHANMYSSHVVLFTWKRNRTTKKPDSKYYKNDALSLDDIDHQYAEVNANRAKKNKDASKQGEKKIIKVRIFRFYKNFLHFCKISRRANIKRAENHLFQHEQSWCW